MSNLKGSEKSYQTLPDGSMAQLTRYYNQSGEHYTYGEGGLGWNPPTQLSEFVNTDYDAFLEFMEQGAGRGSYSRKLVNFMTGYDRFGQMIMAPNALHSGLTFFSRPRLCLTSENLRQDPLFAPLDTQSPGSLAFAIRCWLDTTLSKSDKYGAIASKAAFFKQQHAFFTPLTASLTSISGFPDPYIDTFTTNKGYFGEDQTTAIGSNRLQGTYDLNLSFQDVVYSPVIHIMLYWLAWMDHYTRGTMKAYKIDNMNIRIPYTTSIYRFTLDPSRTYIQHHCKATGCFPKNVPMGDIMNVNEGENFNTSVARFTVNMTTNNVRYNHPNNLISFNRLAERYCPGIRWLPTLSRSAFTNFHGIPYIESSKKGPMLVFKHYDPDAIPPTQRNRNTTRSDEEWR